MRLGEKLEDGFDFLIKTLWIVLIPIILDISNLLVFQQTFKTKYIPLQNTVFYRLGIISAPPSFRFIQQDFPRALLDFDLTLGLRGVINELTSFNILLGITVLLISSFLHSGYLGVLSKREGELVSVRDFFICGNSRWLKFFIFKVVLIIPIILYFLDRSLGFMILFNVIYFYVPYVIVVEERNIVDSFIRGIAFLFNHFWLSIKMAFYFGLIISLAGMLFFVTQEMGIPKIIVGIPLTAYLGVAVNKAVLEIYREVSQTPTEEAF